MGTVIEPTKTPERVRLACDVDLSKATPGHQRCNGTGIVGHQTIDDPGSKTGKQLVPVVCRCVSRRGGVRRDLLDTMAAEIQTQLLDGTFSEQLAADLKLLPLHEKARKIEELIMKAAEPGTDSRLKDQINAALAKLKEV